MDEVEILQDDLRTASTIIEWEFGDTFAIPAWNKFTHNAANDAVLFNLSDEPLKRFSHYYRFEAD